MRSSKRWWLLGFGLVLLGLVAFIWRGLGAGHYAFLSQFGARHRAMPKSGGMVSRYDGCDLYSFTGSLAEVGKAMKRDLTADGWKLLYEDSEFVAFSKTTPGGREEATLVNMAVMQVFMPKPDGTTCVAALPRHRTGLQNALESVDRKFGWTEKLEPVGFDIPEGQFKLDWEKAGDGVDLICRNPTPDPVDATITGVFLDNYESAEPPPFPAKVGPWAIHRIHLHFPGLKHFPEPDSGMSYAFKYRTGGGWGSSSGGSSGAPTRLMCEESGKGQAVRLSSGADGRDLEVKNIEVVVDGAKGPRIAGPVVVTALKDLRIAVPVARYKRITLHAQCRLRPNRRWTNYHTDFRWFRRGMLTPGLLMIDP